MILLLITIVFAVLVTVSHARFLLRAKNHQSDTAPERQRHWQRHVAINGSLWVLLAALIVALQIFLPHHPFSSTLSTGGVLIVITGLALVVWTRLLLGRDQAMGVRFFFPERARRVTGGPYRLTSNPMYDGFILIFLGLGLTTGIVEDFLLAVVSFLLLNIFLARIENRELPS